MAALHLYMEGFYGHKSNSSENGYIMALYGYEIERWNINKYFTPENMRQLGIYFRIKKYGWPYGDGWANCPARLFNLIELLDIEMSKRKDAERKSRN